MRFRSRADAYEVIVRGLRSGDVVWFRGGIDLAQAGRPVDPSLVVLMIEIMNGFSLEPLPDVPARTVSSGPMDALLVVIAELKLAMPQMFAALKALQHRWVRRDDDLASRIGIVLRQLHGEALPTHRGPWLP